MLRSASIVFSFLAFAACDPASKTYECKADDECVTSCTIRGDCCGEGCECSHAYHQDELEAVRKANRRKCEGKELDCPEYKCQKTPPFAGKCEAGKCVAVQRAEEDPVPSP